MPATRSTRLPALGEIRRMGIRLAEPLVERAARIDVATLKRIVVAGMSLRAMLLLVTSGSNDILKWEKFGRHIAAWGVLDEYQRTPRFNHPPLMGVWSRTAVWIADHTILPFHVTFKLLPLAGDVLGLWLIYVLVNRRSG